MARFVAENAGIFVYTCPRQSAHTLRMVRCQKNRVSRPGIIDRIRLIDHIPRAQALRDGMVRISDLNVYMLTVVKATSTVTRRRLVEEENWPQWYRTVLSSEIASLFGPGCRVRDYIRGEFIEEQLRTTNIHWLGKLITIEIALRLVETGWRLES